MVESDDATDFMAKFSRSMETTLAGFVGPFGVHSQWHSGADHSVSNLKSNSCTRALAKLVVQVKWN